MPETQIASSTPPVIPASGYSPAPSIAVLPPIQNQNLDSAMVVESMNEGADRRYRNLRDFGTLRISQIKETETGVVNINTESYVFDETAVSSRSNNTNPGKVKKFFAFSPDTKLPAVDGEVALECNEANALSYLTREGGEFAGNLEKAKRFICTQEQSLESGKLAGVWIEVERETPRLFLSKKTEEIDGQTRHSLELVQRKINTDGSVENVSLGTVLLEGMKNSDGSSPTLEEIKDNDFIRARGKLIVSKNGEDKTYEFDGSSLTIKGYGENGADFRAVILNGSNPSESVKAEARNTATQAADVNSPAVENQSQAEVSQPEIAQPQTPLESPAQDPQPSVEVNPDNLPAGPQFRKWLGSRVPDTAQEQKLKDELDSTLGKYKSITSADGSKYYSGYSWEPAFLELEYRKFGLIEGLPTKMYRLEGTHMNEDVVIFQYYSGESPGWRATAINVGLFGGLSETTRNVGTGRPTLVPPFQVSGDASFKPSELVSYELGTGHDYLGKFVKYFSHELKIN